MQIRRIKDFKRGWFVGNFEPSLYRTNDVEVAVQYYSEGDREDYHHHRIATEISVVVKGRVEMNGKQCVEGDIVIMHPCEAADFLALTDAVLAVVKVPGANNDKYLGGYKND